MSQNNVPKQCPCSSSRITDHGCHLQANKPSLGTSFTKPSRDQLHPVQNPGLEFTGSQREIRQIWQGNEDELWIPAGCCCSFPSSFPQIIQGCSSKGKSSPEHSCLSHPCICIFLSHSPSTQRSFPGKKWGFFSYLTLQM